MKILGFFFGLVIFLSVPALNVFAQKHKADSLLKKIAHLSANDTARLNAYAKIISYTTNFSYDEAIKVGLIYLAEAEKSGYRLGIAGICNPIGLAYFGKSDYKNAESYFRRCYRIAKAAGDKDLLNLCLHNLGLIYYERGDYKNAITYTREALKYAQEVNHLERISSAYNNIATYYGEQNNLSMTLFYLQKSLKIAIQRKDKDDIAIAYNNIGTVHQQQKEYTQAEEYLTKAYKLRLEIGDKWRIAGSLKNLSNFYIETQRHKNALGFILKGKKLYEELGDKAGINDCMLAEANILNNLNQSDSAEKKYLEALKLSKELGRKSSQIYAYNGLALIAARKKEFDSSRNYAMNGLVMTREMNRINELKDFYKIISEADSAQKDFASAYRHYKLYKSFSDSLSNQDKAKELGKLEAQFQFDSLTEKARRTALVEKERRLRYYYLFGGIFVLTLAGAGIFYVRFRAKSKTNRLLAEHNRRIEAQKLEIQQKNEKIEDSIRYAFRIQTAILPEPAYLKQVLPRHFIFYRPKDIVSGDFYQVIEKDDFLFICIADCTGHGVPGAFMSVAGSGALNNAINGLGLTDPEVILYEADRSLKETLHQSSESDSKDGMDVALLVLNRTNDKAVFSGAGRPLYLLRNGEILEIKGDKYPVGGSQHERKLFTPHEIHLTKGDRLFLFTDGITDQFGGDNRRKFSSKRLHDFILSGQNEPVETEGNRFMKIMEEWKGEYPQLDDLTLLGIDIE